MFKPKEYIDIPDKYKKELKFDYDYTKEKRELTEEKLDETKKMSPIEYLNILNEKTKEKLIGLRLNKKIIETYENDLFHNEDEETREIREEEELEFEESIQRSKIN